MENARCVGQKYVNPTRKRDKRGNGVTEQPYTNKHGRPDVPPDETTFTIHGTIKGSAALKEYFKKRSTQKRATPNNPKK